jgi:hypothetical protein
MVRCRRRGIGGSSSRAVDHGVAAMADGVAGRTATSHRMARKDESESCASLSSSSWKKGAGQILTEGGESTTAVLSGAVHGWRGKVEILLAHGVSGEKERWRTTKWLARTPLAAWLNLRGGGAVLAP